MSRPAEAPQPPLRKDARSWRWLLGPSSRAGPPKKKPATLSYGLEESPPAGIAWISAAQHVAVIAIFIVYPLLIAHQAGLASAEINNLLQLGLIGLAVAVFLQALPAGPIGSRLLAPSIFAGVYLAPTLAAVKLGGLPLAWGMTIFAGLVEAALSRVWGRLRPFIPPESTGLVVFMVGVMVGLASLRILLEGSPSGALGGNDGIVAGCALGIMIALNIWSQGRLKLFCILIGMVAGYLLSGATGLLTIRDLHQAVDRPLLAIPSVAHLSWAFDWALAIPFAVTGLAAAMTATAVMTTYQRLTDADWVRPDMNSIGRGLLGDGIANVIGGLLGTYGMTVSTACVGLVAATGVASRMIGFAIAAILLLVALQPPVIGVLAVMPRPVMSSVLLFTASFIMISGVQLISARILDGRRTLVIGMGLLAFIVVSVYPKAFASAPHWAQPLVTSPLVLATLVALALNLVFRIGIRRTVELTVDARAPDPKGISDFIERNAGIWGARRDVISRVKLALQEAVEMLVGESDGTIRLELSYDEFVIDAVLAYTGTTLEFPLQPPSKDEILATDHGHTLLAAFLIRHYADRVASESSGGESVVRLRFDQ
jgi:xanthine permease XanP